MADRQIFFSYSRADAEFVLKLGEDLRAQGVDLWLDQLDIAAGERWDRAVQAALERAPVLVVVLSGESVASANVMDEVSFALEEGKRVVPLLLEECDIPFRIRRLQHLDFTKGYDRGLTRLVRELSGGSAEPAGIEAMAERPEPAATTGKEEPESPVEEEDGTPPKSRSKAPLWVAVAIVAAIGAVVAYQATRPGKPAGEESEAAREEIEGIVLPAWVIADSAFTAQQQAQTRLVELHHNGYSNTGFFWIPEFRYLSGKELYQVYVGPFADRQEALDALCEYDGRMGTETYAVRLSSEPGRQQVTCSETG